MLIINIFCFCHNKYQTTDSVHIFWQPETKLTIKDYQGDTISKIMDVLRKYDFYSSASVGIFTILDIPKKKRNRGKNPEIVYIAPAFEKTTSFTISNDTMQILMQNMFFDINELCARRARKKLQKLQDTLQAYGVLTIFFETVKAEMNKERIDFYHSYFNSVYVEKKEGSYYSWRNLVDKLLLETNEWATKPEDCYRFIKNKPIVEGYIMAPTLFGNLSKDKP